MTGRPYGYTEEYQSYEQTGGGYDTYSDKICGYSHCWWWRGAGIDMWNKRWAIYVARTNNYETINAYATNGGYSIANANDAAIKAGLLGICPYGAAFSNSSYMNYAKCTFNQSDGQPQYPVSCGILGGVGATDSGRQRVKNGTVPPTYGYVTRTRTVTYDKQSGLFSEGIGVPYASYNAGLYSTRIKGIVPVGHMLIIMDITLVMVKYGSVILQHPYQVYSQMHHHSPNHLIGDVVIIQIHIRTIDLVVYSTMPMEIDHQMVFMD